MGLPEELRATVLDNLPCPAIQPGEGRVVLTTVSHLSNCVGSLTVEDEQGQRETIRPTAFHKFYREPEKKWVSLAGFTTVTVYTARLVSCAWFQYRWTMPSSACTT